jgi:hypothetical protein
MGTRKIALAPALQDPKFAKRAEEALENRHYADYRCYMALAELERGGTKLPKEAVEALREREQWNDKFIKAVAGHED